MVAYSIGSYSAQSPVRDRKSGIPDSVDTPAPVRTTQGCASRISAASSDAPALTEARLRGTRLWQPGLRQTGPGAIAPPRVGGVVPPPSSSRLTISLDLSRVRAATVPDV